MDWGRRKENDKMVRTRASCPTCRPPEQSIIVDDRFGEKLHLLLLLLLLF